MVFSTLVEFGIVIGVFVCSPFAARVVELRVRVLVVWRLCICACLLVWRWHVHTVVARRASDHYAHVCLFMCLCSLCWHSHVCMFIAHVLVVSVIVVLVLFALVFTCLYGCCLRAGRVDDHVLDIWFVACGACT